MNKWIIALTVILPTLIEVIDTSVVNVSLDHIRGSLSAGLDEATWSITAYLVSNAIIIPLTGWLSRVFGRKRYFAYSVILFTFSSFMCGNSRNLESLVFFRVLQGIGGGGLQPLSQSILLETFPPSQYGMAMAVFGIGILIGPIIGPVMGGWITDNWSWPWIFYINIPIGIISLVMIKLFIKDPDYIKRVDIRKQFDFWGLGLIVVGIGCLQMVLDKGQREDWFSSPLIVWMSFISILALSAAVIRELRAKDPILNLRVLKNVAFTGATIIQSAAFFALYGSLVLLPLFVQQLLGYNAYLAGMVLAPGGIAALIMMPIVGKAVTRINPKGILVTGILIMGYSMIMMSRFNLQVDYNIICLSRFVMGIGMAMMVIPLGTMAFNTIKKEEIGNASGIYNLFRNISGSFGVAILATMLARRAQFFQSRLSENLSPFDMKYQLAAHNITNVISNKTGHASLSDANGVIYKKLLMESNMNAFLDAFLISGLIMFAVIPLVLLLKRPKHTAAAPEVLGH